MSWRALWVLLGFNDANAHGSPVAGTIAVRDNGIGVVSVAPGANLYAVSDIICGVDWVTGTRRDANPANDIAVANMSLGGPSPAGRYYGYLTRASY